MHRSVNGVITRTQILRNIRKKSAGIKMDHQLASPALSAGQEDLISKRRKVSNVDNIVEKVDNIPDDTVVGVPLVSSSLSLFSRDTLVSPGTSSEICTSSGITSVSSSSDDEQQQKKQHPVHGTSVSGTSVSGNSSVLFCDDLSEWPKLVREPGAEGLCARRPLDSARFQTVADALFVDPNLPVTSEIRDFLTIDMNNDTPCITLTMILQ